MSLLLSWLEAFALTLLIELPVYALLLRRWCRPVTGLRVGLLANVVTHPALWFGLHALHTTGWAFAAWFVASESMVVLAEWAVLLIALKGRDARRSELAGVAALANLCSSVFGLAVQLR